MIKSYLADGAYPEEIAALRALELSSDSVALALNLNDASDGLAQLIAERQRGRTVALLPILTDPMEALLGQIGSAIASTGDPDQRATHAVALRSDQLMVQERRPSELAQLPTAPRNAAALALRLSDLILLGAPGERERWTGMIGRPFRRFQLLNTPEVPLSQGLADFGITIFAPSSPRSSLAYLSMLLSARRLTPAIVAAENPNDAIVTKVVIAPEWRPMRARALAARGHHVVTPGIARVEELDGRIFAYAPPDYRSIDAAVDAAFAASGGRERIEVGRKSVESAVEQARLPRSSGPRVSVIVRTFDRPALLRRAIASIARQRYDNVEIIVVNNGGSDVRDLVRASAEGRAFQYLVMSERKHISAASNVGARAATGEYVGYLDDDDLLYGDHCARTVDVLERTRADVTFTMCVAEYAQMSGDAKKVLGYQVYLDREFTLDDIYVTNISPIHSMVHRRDVFDRFGYFDETLPVTDDWELWLRIASKGGRFVRIDRATCEYSWRHDPARGNMTISHQWDFVNAYKTITARYASDVAGRASILQSQANALAAQEHRAMEAADPNRSSSVVIGSMSAGSVPVAPVPDVFD